MQGVDRQRLVEASIGKRQVFGRSEPELDLSILNGRLVPGRRLPEHLLRDFHAGDLRRGRRRSKEFEADARPKTDLNYLVARLDAEQIDDPGGAFSVRPRQDPSADFSQQALRAATAVPIKFIGRPPLEIIFSLVSAKNVFAPFQASLRAERINRQSASAVLRREQGSLAFR